jgi:hypothetical protein
MFFIAQAFSLPTFATISPAPEFPHHLLAGIAVFLHVFGRVEPTEFGGKRFQLVSKKLTGEGSQASVIKSPPIVGGRRTNLT